MPGQYLAVDPMGRAVMIAAVEKTKLVYVLNRDTSANLTISSPLEANKGQTLCFSLVALDVNYENPVFAALELSYGEADADASGVAAAEACKHLTLYELDLGLNTVVRKWSEPVDNGANLLLAVPGVGDGKSQPGPGGVLVCAENFVSYRREGHPEVTALIPRRGDLPGDRGVLLVSGVVHRATRDAPHFFLLQSEYGDVYAAHLVHAGGVVSELRLRYLDTLPGPCASLALLPRGGFLFAAAEWAAHGFYQLTAGCAGGAGEGGEGCSSSLSLAGAAQGGGYAPVFFEPHPLRNLVLLDEPGSLAPLLALATDRTRVGQGEGGAGVLYAACGAGARSRLALLRPGCAATELAKSPLPAGPSGVWAVRRLASDADDAYIVVSFANATVVLAVGAEVAEVKTSGFDANAPTLACGTLADSSLVQVTPGAMRRIRPAQQQQQQRVEDWHPPGRKTIVAVAMNSVQVVLALSGGELFVFELDVAGGAGGGLQEVARRDTGGDVACLDVSPVPEGRLRARFLALGAYDGTVRLLSLDQADSLSVLATQACSGDTPRSLLLLDVDAPLPGASSAAGGTEDGGLHLLVGLESGVLLRSTVDRRSGTLSDTRRRMLSGVAKAPRLCAVTLRGRRALLALATRPWLAYAPPGGGGRLALTPLAYDQLTHAAGFRSEAAGEGVVATAKDGSLRVFAVERPGEALSASFLPLRFTPRALVHHPTRQLLAVVEADAGVVAPPAGTTRDAPASGEEDGMAAAEEGAPSWSPAEQFGLSRAAPCAWSSVLRLVETKGGSARCSELLELPAGEAALCACSVQFPNYAEPLLAVGVAFRLTFAPRRAEGGAIDLYRWLPDGKLGLLQRTPLADSEPPSALAHFAGGRLAVGVGSTLRLYELGRKKLLRKCELADFPACIVSLASQGERLYVGDQRESIHFVRYKKEDNAFYIFADDTAPRWTTGMAVLDHDTVAGADKFGNLCVLRLPAEAGGGESGEADPTGGRLLAGSGQLNGAPHKLEVPACFHLGATARALLCARLQPGGADVLLYGTVLGGLGALLPFSTREDVDFAQQLEMHMRQEAPPLSGRDHMAYRGAYFPVKDVVDGDLCEQFSQLPHEAQARVAADMERSPAEVVRRLESFRERVL